MTPKLNNPSSVAVVYVWPVQLCCLFVCCSVGLCSVCAVIGILFPLLDLFLLDSLSCIVPLLLSRRRNHEHGVVLFCVCAGGESMCVRSSSIVFCTCMLTGRTPVPIQRNVIGDLTLWPLPSFLCTRNHVSIAAFSYTRPSSAITGSIGSSRVIGHSHSSSSL